MTENNINHYDKYQYKIKVHQLFGPHIIATNPNQDHKHRKKQYITDYKAAKQEFVDKQIKIYKKQSEEPIKYKQLENTYRRSMLGATDDDKKRLHLISSDVKKVYGFIKERETKHGSKTLPVDTSNDNECNDDIQRNDKNLKENAKYHLFATTDDAKTQIQSINDIQLNLNAAQKRKYGIEDILGSVDVDKNDECNDIIYNTLDQYTEDALNDNITDIDKNNDELNDFKTDNNDKNKEMEERTNWLYSEGIAMLKFITYKNNNKTYWNVLNTFPISAADKIDDEMDKEENGSLNEENGDDGHINDDDDDGHINDKIIDDGAVEHNGVIEDDGVIEKDEVKEAGNDGHKKCNARREKLRVLREENARRRREEMAALDEYHKTLHLEHHDDLDSDGSETGYTKKMEKGDMAQPKVFTVKNSSTFVPKIHQ